MRRTCGVLLLWLACASALADEPSTLAALLAHADAQSPVLRVARSQRGYAAAARDAASPLLRKNPELTVAVGPRFAAGEVGVDVELGLMQELALGGERGARIHAAEQLRALTDAEIDRLRWSVHCEVHAEFHRALIEQERVRLAGQVVAFQEEVLRVVERQIAAGEVAPLSLRLAQAEVAQAHQQRARSEQALLASRLKLAQLAGYPSADPPSPSGELETPREPPALAQLIATAGKRLPSLRVAAAKLSEARARRQAADSAASLRPSIGVQYAHESAVAGSRAENILQGVIALPIPSFDKNRGERASAGADVAVAEAELLAAQALLEGEIAVARSEVEAAARRTFAYGREILPRFEEDLALLRRSFELGELDLLALSSGRQRFLEIQSDALEAQLDYFVALAALERVVGGEIEGGAP